MRGNARIPTVQRWEALLDAHGLRKAHASGRPALEFVDGDLLAPGFAINPLRYEALSTSVTHILHAAAHIRFDAHYHDARAVNVGGTQSVIEFARHCHQLRSLGHVSTLYVVGTRRGKLPENAAPEGAFNNSYEQTKYEAEQLVQASGLPFDIYRLSLLQGRAEDGYVHRYLESHMLMDAFCRGTCAVLPGSPDASLDMLPTDYTAQALVRLIAERPASKRIWSIAAGDDAPSLSQLFQLICRRMSVAGKAPPPEPRYLDQRALQELLQSDETGDQGVSSSARTIFETVGPYLLRPKIYTPSQISGMPPAPGLLQWLPSVLDHCMSTGWGRRPATTPI